jgi:phosphomannomutase
VPEIVTEKGGKPVRERVGHAFIKQTMRTEDAPFGGEASGHFYFRDNWYADSGIIGAIIGLYVACRVGKKLSELRELYTRYPAIQETNFTVTDKEAVLAKLRESFADGQQDTLDGLTVDLGNKTWFNVRPSNTEPLLRLNAEADTQEHLDELVAKVTNIISE